MPRKPTPPPPELAAVAEAAAELAAAEKAVDAARAARDRAMLTAKRAGATGDQLAAAAGLHRRNVYPAIAAAEASETEQRQ